MRLFELSPHRAQQSLCWITDDIAIGGASAGNKRRVLRDLGVHTLLDLRTRDEGGGRDHESRDLVYRWFPIDDFAAPAPIDLLEVSAWVSDRLRSGKALINCREGRGRSALVACATLMRLGHSIDGAYQVVRRGQPQVALSGDQVRALEESTTLQS